MDKEKLFEEFKEEMNSLVEVPCAKPYDYSSYDEKTKKVLKDIDENRNHSWIKEIWDRNKNNLDSVAILYRGRKFTYKEFFTESYRYAKAMKASGMNKGMEFVCAIENTPEFPFIMGAASLIGAVPNLVSSEFDPDYLKEMLDRSDAKCVFVSDMSFAGLAKTLKDLDKQKTAVIIPLDNTLSNGNPYKEITEEYYKLDEEEYKNALKSVRSHINIKEFLTYETLYDGKVAENIDLNDPATITYTSGSTGWGRPKALKHHVRSYISMGRNHDPEVSGIPTMKGKTTLALIKTMSDTDFMSNVSDTFIQGGICALEPINDKEFFLTSMLIHKPSLVIASRSYWLYAMKQQQEKQFKNVTLPYTYVPTSVGEPLPANEEKALNKWLKEVKAGTKITKTPFSLITMSVAGGDSEHGGIFLVLYRALQSKLPSHRNIDEPIGMGTYGMVEVKALRDDGTYCDFMEPGRLVANSPCTMEGYVNNEKENDKFFIKDAYGKEWANLGTYGYVDKTKHVYVKGRIPKEKDIIPNYKIQDTILKDTKKIMSCEVVNVGDNFIAHIEPQMNTSFNSTIVLESAANRCKNEFGEDILDKLYFRIHDNEESFKLLHTGKRNTLALVEEGISDKCIKASEIDNINEKGKVKKLTK